MRSSFLKIRKASAALISVGVVILVSGVLLPFRGYVNSTEVALTLLLLVLFSSTLFGSRAGLAASIAGILSFNFFFLPPFYTLNISGSDNWVAFGAFLITALLAGQVSGYARRRAEESEARQKEIERLYDELKTAFKTATEAEALKQSEKLKSALLDAVTHDLRTPLTSIKAAVTTLLESEGGHRTIELDPEGRLEFLNIVNEETDRLNRFIEGMVGLAQLEAGTSPTKTSLATLDEILPIALERAASLPGNHIVRVSQQAELPLVRADARAVAEVLYNLLENAAKYSPPGSTITISAGADSRNVNVAINDEGSGIPADMREKVFEKFVRLGDVNHDGMGLGLAIARGIVEAQGGKIEIRHGDGGRGTKVVVTLPIGE
jgi:two-component system sensor histidine kinase KdpD